MTNRFPGYLVLTVVHTQAGEDGVPCRFSIDLTIGTFSTSFLIVVSQLNMLTPDGVLEPNMRLETSMTERRGLITREGEYFLIEMFRRNIYGKQMPVTFFSPLSDGQLLPLFLPRQFGEEAA